MSRNGSGVYSKVNTFVSGNPVTAAGHNQNWDDLVTEMTNSVAADGQTSMTGPLKASSGTAALPSHTFASDPNTGGYRSASDEYSVSAGGTQIAAFNSGGIDIKTGGLEIAGVAAFPVPTAQIDDEAVTLAKMANLASGAFIVRYTASTGVPQAGSFGSGLSLNTTTGALSTTTNPSLLPGFLSGLELSTAGSSATFGIATGGANDSGFVTLMALTSAYTKTTSAWALGTGNGALDTGSIANNTWYHVYLIARSDTGVVDVLVSTSVSAPTMPANYDRKRRIGSLRTNGSAQWTSFTQVGDNFIWLNAVSDVSAIATTTSRVATTVTVPTGVAVTAMMRASLSASGAGSTATFIQSPLENDVAPTSANANIFAPVSGIVLSELYAITSTSAQVAVRSSNATGTLTVNTFGWVDRRGK